MPAAASAACKVGVLVPEPANSPAAVASETPSGSATSIATMREAITADGRESDVLEAGPAEAGEKLRPVLNPHPIDEHHKAKGSDQPRRRRLWRDGADDQAGEQARRRRRRKLRQSRSGRSHSRPRWRETAPARARIQAMCERYQSSDPLISLGSRHHGIARAPARPARAMGSGCRKARSSRPMAFHLKAPI